jgi:hypothetical protein
VAVLASAAVMLLAVVVVPIETVGNLASLFSLLGFTIVNLSVIQLRRRQPNMARPFEIPLYPLPPVLGVVCNLALGFFISPETWALAIGWLAVGVVVYLALERLRAPEPVPEPGVGVGAEPGPAPAADTDADAGVADEPGVSTFEDPGAQPGAVDPEANPGVEEAPDGSESDGSEP